MLLRLFVFLAGQIILLFGGWWTISSLVRRKQLLTVWGAVICAWYCYLVIWYGPTSLFVALGSKYVFEVATHPWWLRDDMLIASLLNAMLLQAFPFVLNAAIYRKRLPLFQVLFVRLEPLLGHVTCFWFGLLGTFAQVYAGFSFGDLWLQGQFDFGSLSLVQKSALSGFFIFTIGPQVSLLFYRHCRSKSFLSDPALTALAFFSLIGGLYAFSAFGQRTYVLFEIALIAYLFLSASGRYKKFVIGLFPVVLFFGYTITSMHNRIRISPDPFEIVSLASARFVDDFSYRSHIANDSVLIGARACVLGQLDEAGLSAGALVPIELASGFPRLIRQVLPIDLAPVRLETLVGNCYRKWLNIPNANIDLSDSKGQYFLIIFGQFLGPFVSSVFWLFLHLFYILLIYMIFSVGLRFVAFAVPASVHFLVLATTPGEIFVLVKAMIPYLLILFTISFFWHSSRRSGHRAFE